MLRWSSREACLWGTQPPTSGNFRGRNSHHPKNIYHCVTSTNRHALHALEQISFPGSRPVAHRGCRYIRFAALPSMAKHCSGGRAAAHPC
jgi:hypothetical protein